MIIQLNFTKDVFQCENIVEDQEETILQLFAKESPDMDIELCSKRFWRKILPIDSNCMNTHVDFAHAWNLAARTEICPAVEPPPEEYEFEKDEL